MTTTFKQHRLALQIFQSNRLRRDYHDLAAIPQYDAVGEFFFTEMYGPRDFSDRDEDARRIHHFIQILPGVHLNDVQQVLSLLELTNALDDGLTKLMIELGVGIEFDEATYDRAYRVADNYTARLQQLNLVNSSLHNVYRLSRSHFLGVGLHSSRPLASLAGIEAGHTFLLKGYDALRGVSDITLFADTVHKRELIRLNQIYGC